MTVKELKNLLKKCDDENMVKIKVKHFSVKAEEIIDETIEEPVEAIQQIFLGNQDNDTFMLSITLYED